MYLLIKHLLQRDYSHHSIIIGSAIYCVLLGNFTFFTNLRMVYPLDVPSNVLFTISLSVFFICIYVLFLSLFVSRWTLKPIIIFFLMLMASTGYFIDTYHVVIDGEMIDNIVNTHFNEAVDLMSIWQLAYIFFWGVIPSVFIYKIQVKHPSLIFVLRDNLIRIVSSVIIIAVLILLQGNYYAVFFREHHSLRYYSNPMYPFYSLIKYTRHLNHIKAQPLKQIALDARLTSKITPRKIIFFVVGETARADHFALNGYDKPTNPLLSKEKIINFEHVSSCGTSTIISVPCMFAESVKADFDKGTANSTENLLDILQRIGVNVLWLDNNSDSKGVALRVPYKNYRLEENNPVCDTECRDEGMLANLQTFIDQHPEGDIMIVMHQMGNHGPAYYKRYPAAFGKFQPICDTNQLETCSSLELNNVYDNIILYTDYVLSQAIKLLNENSPKARTALIYVSDHGESLGEKGLYLHGLPYIIAPQEQTHVPMIMWFSENFYTEDLSYDKLSQQAKLEKYSHDNIFHTMLGLFEVETSVYKSELDIFEQKK